MLYPTRNTFTHPQTTKQSSASASILELQLLHSNTMAGIQIISTSSIQAASHDTNLTHKIELTPWDLQLLPIETIQKGLLFQNPKSKHTLIQHLKHSLSTTLSFFPFLAGRLAVVEHGDDTASVSIICNNAGAEFVHAIADNTTCSDILEPVYVPRIVHFFFPLNGVKGYECTSKPLLAVQVTELVDAVFIGCSANHSVADGTSFWHFFNSWAEISRGSEKVSKSPAFNRWFLDGVEPPIRIPFTKEMKMADGFNSEVPKERIFHFTKEKIVELKAKANAEANTNRISSLQAILTHLWRSVVRHQHLEPEEEVKYKLLIGARPRMLNPPLPENYFGNAVMVGTITMKAGELVKGGIGKAALEMNKVIASHTEEKIKSYYETWVKNPKIFTLSAITGNALGTSSSPRYDFYGNDFGWGKPVAVRSGAANKSNGKLSVFAGAEQGSLDIELCFSYQILDALVRDSEFMDAVST